VDRHRLDADPDPKFHVDADPDPNLDWHQNNADPHVDLSPSFTHVGKSEYFFTFIHSIARLQCFSFLISVKCAAICSVFDILQFSGKKVKFINFTIA
jgi:hypothetical protein